jgi:PBP1b-binding outer membrane lipoprotein LpoB
MKSITSLLLIAVACLVGGCASAPAEPASTVDTAQAQAAAAGCVKTTGSNICRTPGSGNMNVVNSISGEDLRRSGGPITGATPGRTGD